MNKNNLIKSFIIGGSPLVFIPFYLGLKLIPESNIDMTTYAINVSIYFGFMNMISNYLGSRFNLSLDERLKLISVISILIIWSVLWIYTPYNFKSESRWIIHGISVAIAHIIAFMVIIRSMEEILSEKN